MSKEPLSLPTGLFIFKNLTCHGFWQSRWYERATVEEREELVGRLVALKVSCLLMGWLICEVLMRFELCAAVVEGG